MKKTQVVKAAFIVLCASFGFVLANPGQSNSEPNGGPDSTAQQKQVGNQDSPEGTNKGANNGPQAANRAEKIQKSKEQSAHRREVIQAQQEEQKRRAAEAIAGVRRAKTERVKASANGSSKAIELKAKEFEQNKKKKSDGKGDKK